MVTQIPESGLQLFSTITDDWRLELTLRQVPLSPLADDDVLVRVEATPINPSDIALLLSVADMSAISAAGKVTSAPIPTPLQRQVNARKGIVLPVGNEGAGTVIAAGVSDAAQALIGKTVSLAGGQMYAQYKKAKARDCLLLPDDVSAEMAASSFVNPLTALGMVGTMRAEGFTGLIHTAAASNLGQMLVKLTNAEGINLINIVRSQEQAALLESIGAKYVVDSTSSSFANELRDAIRITGAFLAFDAIGGGPLANQILQAMEAASAALNPGYSVYGSTQKKHVYIYGGLNPAPTEITRSYGMTWAVGGWLLTPYLQQAGPVELARCRSFVAEHIRDIFASKYTASITLHEAIDPQVIARYSKRTTGEKYLITPNS